MLASTVALLLMTAPAPALADIHSAIEQGRLDQARAMIELAASQGTDESELARMRADLAFETGQDEDALARYEALLAANPTSSELAERVGLTALRLGRDGRARAALRQSVAAGGSWRAWSALGVLADRGRLFEDADHFYDKALAMAPGRAEILNNLGWSHLLRGDSDRALALFELALAAKPHSDKIARNLELARSASDARLPARKTGESDFEWAARLNDAGVIAAYQQQDDKAAAAFAQAIAVSAHYYERASNNLAILEERE